MGKYAMNDNENSARVVDAEIVDEGSSARGYGKTFYGGANTGGRVFISSYSANRGCLSASFSFFLFLVCLVQFGLLAAIGFAFFLAIGSTMGAVRASRQLMLGLPWNPWPWRCGNWIISFLLTAWLAGGFS